LKGTGAQVEDQFVRSSASPLQRFSIVPGGQGIVADHSAGPTPVRGWLRLHVIN
jgi:hypothetical protein